jgi:hypothetical protein
MADAVASGAAGGAVKDAIGGIEAVAGGALAVVFNPGADDGVTGAAWLIGGADVAAVGAAGSDVDEGTEGAEGVAGEAIDVAFVTGADGGAAAATRSVGAAAACSDGVEEAGGCEVSRAGEGVASAADRCTAAGAAGGVGRSMNHHPPVASTAIPATTAAISNGRLERFEPGGGDPAREAEEGGTG